MIGIMGRKISSGLRQPVSHLLYCVGRLEELAALRGVLSGKAASTFRSYYRPNHRLSKCLFRPRGPAGSRAQTQASPATALDHRTQHHATSYET